MKDKFERFAVVMGDIDMLRPLGIAGVPCAIVADRGALPRYSKYAKAVIEWADPWAQPELQAEKLIEFAAAQNEKPVLFYQSDADLLLISRMRESLSPYFDFVIPDAELVEDLVDKSRFESLAEKLSLPVPKTSFLYPGRSETAKGFDLNFPVIVKPQTRKVSDWSPIAGLGKAVRMDNAEELQGFIQRFVNSDTYFVVQELIPGPESSIESYHAYVDGNGEIAGEFAGKKIRTYPAEFGQSCALTITDAADVAEIGREILKKIGLKGLAKLDFKRAPDGKLYLLEINPRFNLWHHLGAVAGVNLPLTVYCDLTGNARLPQAKAKAGVSWCRAWQDFSAARKEGVSFPKWLAWAYKCQVKPGLAWDDPMPLIGAAFWRTAYKVLPDSLLGKGVRHRAQKTGALKSDESNRSNSDAIRVLMITSEYPSEQRPYGVPFIKRQVEHLRRAGIEVDVFNFKGKKNFLNYIAAWRRLRKHTAGKTYDLMHAQWGHSAALALPKRLPWVITFRGNDLEGIIGKNGKPTLLGKILKVVSGTMAKLADGAIVVSESLGNRLKRKDYEVIPSGLDLEIFHPEPKAAARKALGFPAKKKLVLFAASSLHNPRKRYELAQAAMEIVKKNFDAELIVASKLSHSKIAEHMNACDALLLTSVHEGSPNVVKEALACNLPVVSVDVGDVRQRIESIDGCFVAKDDAPATIAAAVEKVFKRNKRVNGQAAIADLDERVITQRVIGVYKKVLSSSEARQRVLGGKAESKKPLQI